MADDFDLDLGPAIREAILLEPTIADDLGEYSHEPAVFTRRPIPQDAPDLYILINPPAAIGDEDPLNAERTVWMGDIAIYGKKAAPGSDEDDTRTVEALGFRVRRFLHRQKWALQVGGFHVIDIRASGPVPAPVDDDKTIGRIVSLIVRLGRNA